jgi:hypothetical protein
MRVRTLREMKSLSLILCSLRRDASSERASFSRLATLCCLLLTLATHAQSQDDGGVFTWSYVPNASDTSQWTWMGGSATLGNTGGRPGIYGTMGTPATGNIPGGRYGSATWIDNSGHLWLFAGCGYDVNGVWGEPSDLWEFNPATNEWAWMGGSSSVDQPGAYGTLGTPDVGNFPGGRNSSVHWSDNNGNFWLFGGNGFAASYASQ